jgi:large subunit ribosomal protein L25
LPLQIPERIAVDASGLRVGESLHVSDLKVEAGIRILEDVEQTVVSIAAPMSEAKLEQLLTSPTGAEVKEPELVGKEKKEEGEEPAKGEVKTDEKTKAKKEESKEEKKEPKPKG